MKIQSITYILFFLSFLIFISCNEQSTQTALDAISEKETIDTQGPVYNNISQFIHPGISISSSILNQVSSESYQYRKDGYDEILDTIDNRITYYTSFPSIVYRKNYGSTPTSERMRDDANLAYAHTLKWAREGDQDDADKAIAILNGWATHFEEIKPCKISYPDSTGCPNDDDVQFLSTRLYASWVAPTFATVAEIIRHYNNGSAGWSSTDAEAFETFLLELNNTYIDHIVTGVINTPTSTWANNNWGASAAYAQMAIGVYTESSSIYAKGKNAIVKNNGLIENIIDYPSGEVNELASRDCEHPQYSLTALTYAADIDRLQGSFDIYNAHSKRLRDGWKGMAKAFDPNVTFVRDCSNGDILQGVEKIYNYWINQSELETLRNRQDPYGLWHRIFYGFTTYTHYCTNTNLTPPC